MDAADDVHAFHDPAEGGVAEMVAGRVRAGVHAGIGADADHEIAHRAVGRSPRHRDRAVAVEEAGAAGRLEPDRRQEQTEIVADAALDEAVLWIVGDVRAAVEDDVVEPMLIDIGDEILGRDRRVAVVELQHDRPGVGFQPHPHRIADRRAGRGRVGGGGVRARRRRIVAAGRKDEAEQEEAGERANHPATPTQARRKRRPRPKPGPTLRIRCDAAQRSIG